MVAPGRAGLQARAVPPARVCLRARTCRVKVILTERLPQTRLLPPRLRGSVAAPEPCGNRRFDGMVWRRIVMVAARLYPPIAPPVSNR